MPFWKSAIIFGAVVMTVASGQNAPARPPPSAAVPPSTMPASAPALSIVPDYISNPSKGRPTTTASPPAGPPAPAAPPAGPPAPAAPPAGPPSGSQNPFGSAPAAPASYPNPFAPAPASASYPNPFADPPSSFNPFDSAPQGSCNSAPQSCQPPAQPINIVLSCSGNQPSSGIPVPPATAPIPPPGATDASFYYDSQGFPLGTPVGGFPPGFHISEDGTPIVPPGVPRPPPYWDGTPSTLGFPMPNPGTPLWNMLMYWPIPQISV